jgi:hypothetical protein
MILKLLKTFIAIGRQFRHLGFTFLIGRMTEVLTPDDQIYIELTGLYLLLGVTIARKVLPHPQGIKGSMQNLLNKGLFI